MKRVFTLFLFLVLGCLSLKAQLKTDYIKFYDDNFIDTFSRGMDMVLLESGDLALASTRNRPGGLEYKINVDIITDKGEVVNSVALDPEGTSSLAKISQAPDGSIWLVYSILVVDASATQKTGIVQFSPDLSTIRSEATLDLLPGTELPFGFLAAEDQLFVFTRGITQNETTGFNEVYYNLHSINKETLVVQQEVIDAIPRRSTARNNIVNILPVAPDRIGIGIIPRDTAFNALDLLIREFSTTDLSQVDEYSPAGLGGFSVSTDIAYIPNLDAYGVLDSRLNTYFLKRGTGSNPMRDTIPVPDGLRPFTNNLTYLNNSLYVMGRNTYRIDFTEDAVDTVIVLEGYESTYRLTKPTLDSNIVTVNTFGNTRAGLRVIIYENSTASFPDTLDLVPPRSGAGVSSYYGAFTFPPQVGEAAPILGIKQNGEVGDAQLTWGFEIVDADTGERTGQTISTNDISFWAENTFFDDELASLVAVGDGYMGIVNERRRVTFFRFDDSLRVLQPNEAGFGVAEFNPQPNLLTANTMRVAPTSYGIFGAVFGSANINGSFVYQPYVFACDTSFQTTIAASIDTLTYYPFEPLKIAVDTMDQIYTVGLKAETGNQFGRSDTLIITAHNADASLRYITELPFADRDYALPTKVVLNNDQTELLISGSSFSGIFRFAYFARINVADGSLIELKSFDGTALGSIGGEVTNFQALYDANDNILSSMVAFERKPSGYSDYELRVAQFDSMGNIVENELVFTSVQRFVQLINFSRIGEALFLSGTYNSSSGIEREAFLFRVNTGKLVNTKEVDVSDELQFKAFPNPTADRLTLTWQNAKASDFSLRIFDGTGRPIRTWTGNRGVGEAQVDVSLIDLPKGTYFIRLDMADGFLLRPVIKQ